MKHLEYSPEAKKRIKQIQQFVTTEYGDLVAKKVIQTSTAYPKLIKTISIPR